MNLHLQFGKILCLLGGMDIRLQEASFFMFSTHEQLKTSSSCDSSSSGWLDTTNLVVRSRGSQNMHQNYMFAKDTSVQFLLTTIISIINILGGDLYEITKNIWKIHRVTLSSE